MKLCQRQPGVLLSCAGHESYFGPRVLKSCFNAYVLPNLEYCAVVWMSSVESLLSLLNCVVRSAEMLCEIELCFLGHRRKVRALC